MRIFGKINLYLTVGAERPSDHRHEIRTLFLPATMLSDEVIVSQADIPGVICNQTGRSTGCAPQDNLCVKAAQAYCSYFGLAAGGLVINLEKRIPVSAGFGGGSADAAAILLEMERIFKKSSNPSKDLSSIAVQLGADVSYFLNARPAMATGIGDILTQVEVTPSYQLVIAYPHVPSPVKWAYQHWYRPVGIEPPVWEDLPHALTEPDPAHLARFCWNDLGFALEQKYPLLAMIRQTMLENGALAAAVSGSGSGLFAICRNEHSASILRAALKEAFSNIDVF